MKDVSLQAIHHIANKLGYKEKHIGGKVGYDKSVYTVLTRHLNELMDYDKAIGIKRSQKPLKQPQIEPNYYMMNGERNNRDYEWESIMKRYIIEAIDELDLYHGSRADFNEFDLAYLSNGRGTRNTNYAIFSPKGIKILKKEKLGESKVLQGDLFSGEFSDEPIKKWKKENDKKKANEKRRQAYKEKKEEENNRKRIEQYKKDSKKMRNGGLFGKEEGK